MADGAVTVTVTALVTTWPAGLSAANRNCAPLSASGMTGVKKQLGSLLVARMSRTDAHDDPFQRCMCRVSGSVPLKATHSEARWSGWIVTLAGCCRTVGITLTCTVSTAGALVTSPAPLYTATLYTAPELAETSI